MWNLNNIRESASGILRRAIGSGKQEDSSHPMHKDAMNNLVTPRSIVEFTLPPMRKTDSLDEASESIQDSSRPSSEDGRSNLQVPEFAHDCSIRSSDRCDSGGGKQSYESTSPWNIKAKLNKKKSDSRSGSPAPNSSPICSIIEPEPSPPKAKGRDLDDNPGMSLQHLIERKDGFDLLTESPNTKRKESLFLMQNDNRPRYGTNGIRINKSLRDYEENIDSPQASPRSPQRKPIVYKSDQKSKVSDKPSRTLPDSYEESFVTATEQDQQTTVDNSNHDCGRKHSALPSVHLRLSYSAQCKRIDLCIVEGKDLHWRHSFYFKVSLLPHDESYRIEVSKPEDASPKIHGNVTFENIEMVDIPIMTLKIFCKEKISRIRHADVLGFCLIPLFDVDFSTANDLWVTLRPFEGEESPHVLLSVCYDEMLGFLTIEVLAVRNVPKGRLGRLSDAFMILKNDGDNQRNLGKTTKTVQRTQHPVFRDSFIFPLHKEDGMDQLVIDAALYIKDRVRGSVEKIGYVKIGQEVETALARSQFARAVIEIKKAVTCWHPLKEATGCEK